MKHFNLFKMMIILLILFLIPDVVKGAQLTNPTIVTETYKEEFLKYPRVTGMENSGAQEKINEVLLKHIQTSYEAYLKLMKDMEEYKKEVDCEKLALSCVYSYNTRYEVKYNKGDKLSILVYDATYSGGAHGLEGVASYNFNLQSGKQITLNDLLLDQSKYSKITDYVKKYMKDHQELFFDEEILKDFTVNQETQFYFTDTGIDLIFQEYEVAAYAAGHPTISIPKSVYE